jgi:hypothetical protein
MSNASPLLTSKSATTQSSIPQFIIGTPMRWLLPHTTSDSSSGWEQQAKVYIHLNQLEKLGKGLHLSVLIWHL